MFKLKALIEARNEKVTAMRGILSAADGRDLNADESSRYDVLDKEVDSLNEQIKREQKLSATETEMATARPSVGERQILGTRPGGPEANKEFSSFGEFLHAVRFNQNDQRLDWQQNPLQAEQNMGTGSDGGFAVPKQFRTELLEVEQSPGAIRPRATVIPAGTPPDSAISMPALDQSDTTNMFGGVEVSWIQEGGDKPETSAKLREIILQPKEVAAHIIVSDKLLRNWVAAGTVLSTLLRKAIFAAEDAKFISGNSAGAPLGMITSGATIAVPRQVDNTIEYEDVVAMEEQLIANAMPVWLTTRKGVGQLRRMKDDEGHLVWQESAVGSGGPTLLGYPVVIVSRMPQLGSKGDLALCDLSYYLIKDGSGPFVAASEHVHFKQNKTVIKAFWNVDGQPWLTSPIVQENSDQQSPFVVLDVAAST